MEGASCRCVPGGDARRRAHRLPHRRQQGRGLPRLAGRRRLHRRARPRGAARARDGFMLRARRAGAPRPCSSCALAVLGFLDATYLAGPLHFGEQRQRRRRTGRSSFVAAALIAARVSSPRAAPPATCPLVLALAAIVVLHVVDLVAGARLELNTVFGYSATIGIRVSGQGNLTFAQLTAAVILLAGLRVWRRPGRAHRVRVIAMLAVTLLVMAAPPWGGDFGAAIAGAPGLRAPGLVAPRTPGPRPRPSSSSAWSSWSSGLLVGFVDLLRPKDAADPRRSVLRPGERRTASAASSSSSAARRWRTSARSRRRGCVWLMPIGRCCSSATCGGRDRRGCGALVRERRRSSRRRWSPSRSSRSSATRSTTPGSRSPR